MRASFTIFLSLSPCRSCSLSFLPIPPLHPPAYRSLPASNPPLFLSLAVNDVSPTPRGARCVSTAVRGTIVDLFLVCARQCLVAPLIEFACRQHGGRCGGATIVVSKRGECYATTAAPSWCPERRRVYQLLSSAATPSQPPPPPPCLSFPSFPPPLPCSPLLPPSFPPLLPPSLATTTIAAAVAAATATSQSAGFLAFVRTGDHRVVAEPTGKKKYIQHFTILPPLFPTLPGTKRILLPSPPLPPSSLPPPSFLL